MSDWVHIDEPVAKPLTYLQRRIMELMQQGKSFGQICGILLIRSDHLRDEIFEIRKYEAIMGKGKLTNEQRAAIYEGWKSGVTQAALAKEFGVSLKSVNRICAILKAENDPAVIAECGNADTIVDTIEATKPEVPEAVLKAVQDKIDSLTAQIAVNCERIESITEQNDRMKERSETLQKWLKEVQA